jgi:hypothetical protein
MPRKLYEQAYYSGWYRWTSSGNDAVCCMACGPMTKIEVYVCDHNSRDQFLKMTELINIKVQQCSNILLFLRQPVMLLPCI